MGRPITGNMFKIDMSHQEMERMLSELEEWYAHSFESGAEWITAEAAGSWLRHDLGYEDEEEFQDALNGTFEEFLNAMPHIDTKRDDKGRLVFRVKPEPPVEEWRPVKMTLKIVEREDLWNVCFKSQHARVEIPELEFEICQDGKKHIDSIYNHVAGAVFNLGSQVQDDPSICDDHREKIAECLHQLNLLLDLQSEWHWVIYDPSGTSLFSNMDKVKVEYEQEQAGLEAHD